MSWTLPIYQSVALSEFFKQTLGALAPASVCLNGIDGKCLWVESANATDLTTLPSMAQICHQYLNLNDGEIAICNDPYTGGTDLSHVTLVIGVGSLAKTKSDFILAVRFALEPHWIESGKLNDEGVRIPPTPVGSLKAPNWDLLAMIGSQPQSPRGFDHALRSLIERTIEVHVGLQHALNERNGIFHKACGKDFLAVSTRAFRKQMGHLALGESFASTRLSSGELVKLRLKVEDEKILFDFSGTDASAGIHLTELMTFSVCFSALQDVLAENVICNSGAFDSIVVSAPAKTLLNAKAPAGTWRGAHEGAGELHDFLVSHLRKLNKSTALAPVASHAGFVEVSFEGTTGGFFYSLPNGANADSTPDAFLANEMPWLLSAEEIETRFPLIVKQFGARRDSGGAGQTRGGDRRVLTLETLAPARVRWNFVTSATDRDVSELQGSVFLIDSSSKDQAQPLKGEAALSAGHALSFSTAAGRGAGSAASEDEN